jgi:hypothetical protein
MPCTSQPTCHGALLADPGPLRQPGDMHALSVRPLRPNRRPASRPGSQLPGLSVRACDDYLPHHRFGRAIRLMRTVADAPSGRQAQRKIPKRFSRLAAPARRGMQRRHDRTALTPNACRAPGRTPGARQAGPTPGAPRHQRALSLPARLLRPPRWPTLRPASLRPHRQRRELLPTPHCQRQPCPA